MVFIDCIVFLVEFQRGFKMEQTKKFKYYVIQFLQLPYKGIDEYICVPWSWIVLRRKQDQRVIVSYPVENPSDTAKRVKKRQKRSYDWKLYMSDIIYGTDVYEDAEIFINEKITDAKYSNQNKRDQDLSAPVKKKTRRPKRNSKSNHDIGKPLDLVTSENSDKSETKQLKRTALPTPGTEAALKRSKVVEPNKSVSDAAEHPRIQSQAIECLIENQPSPTREDFPMRNSCSSEISVEECNDRTYVEETERVENQPSPTREDFSMRNSCSSEISVEECNDRTYVEETERVENNEQERPSVTKNSSNSTDSLSNPQMMIDPRMFYKELFTVLHNLHTVSANSYTLIDNLRRVIINNTETLKNVKQLIVDSRSSNSDIPTTSPLTNTTVEVEMISEMNQSKQQQQQNEYDDCGDDDTDEVSKKRRSRKRKFVLPPEYDENDSRWTLKHHELAPGLVELMPHTSVYINSVALSQCKRLSKDCKSLARILLVEIFTKSALTICSLTGSRARAYDVEGATIRPGLDENARTVLLVYVEEYGREKGWITVDTQSIQNSLRNKMQEFRSKFG
ncbi:hypothetical protein PYW08_002726 [Mythimna loreyi]|uniref:Uncharacterized protein n=1 Tax=Mythimna loreyi TaxID=667449 RepID=A0ACC2QNU9_9NEOP|nr:hypothetical protein PYW08_002726 [Mythimna loreyi]